MRRRDLLLVGCSTVALAACASAPSPVATGVSSALSLAQSVLTGLTDLIQNTPNLSSIVGAATMAKLSQWLVTLQSAVAALSAAPTTSTGLPSVSTILSVATNILGALGIALPPPFDLIVPAVSTLLPTLGNIFGITLSRRLPGAATMSVQQAQAIIAEVHARVAH